MKQRAFWKWIVGALLIGGAFFFIERVGPVRPAQSQRSEQQRTGSEAPQFTLSGVHGETIALSAYRGKVVVLDFWAPWCPPCRQEIPDFIALQNAYASKGLQVIGVGLDKPQNIASFEVQEGINYPVALGNNDVADLYGGVDGIPTTFIIDRQGNIRRKFVGYTDKGTFENEIKRLL